MNSTKDYWFPAKRYGWGWGLPRTWQGWVVFVVYLAAIIAAPLLFPPASQPLRFFGSITLLSAALTLICWLKGEPPRWRWGK